MNKEILPPSELTDADYKIFAYIELFDHVSKEAIVTKLQNKVDAIEYRIKCLSSIDWNIVENSDANYILQECKDIGTTFEEPQLIVIDSYHLSELGKKVLQDYREKKKHEMRILLLKSVWLPVAVTILTNIVLYAIQWLWLMIPR